MRAEDESVIVRFVDAIWLEDGLGEKTRQAYRSDLLRLSEWLESQPVVRIKFDLPDQLVDPKERLHRSVWSAALEYRTLRLISR